VLPGPAHPPPAPSLRPWARRPLAALPPRARTHTHTHTHTQSLAPPPRLAATRAPGRGPPPREPGRARPRTFPLRLARPGRDLLASRTASPRSRLRWHTARLPSALLSSLPRALRPSLAGTTATTDRRGPRSSACTFEFRLHDRLRSPPPCLSLSPHRRRRCPDSCRALPRSPSLSLAPRRSAALRGAGASRGDDRLGWPRGGGAVAGGTKSAAVGPCAPSHSQVQARP
jgi:hypothetical protein